MNPYNWDYEEQSDPCDGCIQYPACDNCMWNGEEDEEEDTITLT